jgi:hypothetical protein
MDKPLQDKADKHQLNTSRVGQGIVAFEKASATSAAPSATSSIRSSPPDVLNPFSTSSPFKPTNSDNSLSGLGDTLGDSSGNLADAVNDGLGDVIKDVVEGVVNQAGVKDFYYVYLQRICSGMFASGDDSNADGVQVDDCRSWEEAGDSKANTYQSLTLS